jgi:hypothetical protein
MSRIARLSLTRALHLLGNTPAKLITISPTKACCMHSVPNMVIEVGLPNFQLLARHSTMLGCLQTLQSSLTTFDVSMTAAPSSRDLQVRHIDYQSLLVPNLRVTNVSTKRPVLPETSNSRFPHTTIYLLTTKARNSPYTTASTALNRKSQAQNNIQDTLTTPYSTGKEQEKKRSSKHLKFS